MRKLRLVIFLGLMLLPIQPGLAAPVPPELIVNHETGQCASFFPGDECSYGVLPSGWVSLGFEGDAECPVGYEVVLLEVQYRGIKDQHCCSEWGSGAPGACGDMVINRRTEHCAFVAEIEGCFLPAGWQKMPQRAAVWECPAEYSWIADLQCLTEEEAAPAARRLPVLSILVVFAALGFLALCAALVGLLVWVLVRRRR